MLGTREPEQPALFDIDEPGLDNLVPIEFVPTPLWLLRIGTIDGNAKYVFTALLSMYGDVEDGKRLKAEFPPVAQEQLARYLRLSPHVVARCIGDLQAAHNCPRCRHRHPLMRAERLGRSDAYRYRIVKCDSTEDLLPLAPPAARRNVVLPMQWRAIRDGGPPAAAAVGDDGAPERAVRAPLVVAPVAADPKVGILREIQRYHGREVTAGVLEAIAARCFDGAAIATRLEHLLDRVRDRANHERRAVTPTFAIAVIEEAQRAPAGFDPESFENTVPRDDRDHWELGRIFEIVLISGQRPTVAEARRSLEELRTLIVAHLGSGDQRAITRMVEQVLTDPRVFGKEPYGKPRHPLRFLLDGVRTGFLLTLASEDDGSAKLGKAFARIDDGRRERALEIARQHIIDDVVLDHVALARCGVTSAAMRGYIVMLAREGLQAT